MVVYVNQALKGIPVLFVEASHLTIKRKHRELERMIKAEMGELMTLYERHRPILAAYHDLHARFGGQVHISAPEYLYDFIKQRSRLMQINSLVDSYNYISLKYALALGAHDLDKVEGKIAFNLTTGKERFHPLGATGPVPVSPGEYAYMDAREILCRLEVKQCEKTKITPETTNAFFIIQGNAATPMDYLYRAADELMGLIATYCQGQVSLATIEYTGSE
ncbi:B3/B4 domain-containing protein [Neomoorella thermoacetica]|uniref:B3/B4 domain-containing protein n=1 Tax=Neomoorella thermoacetica TaxID=1525 RepID=UPI0008FB828E|nr:phenylalanine--tRNA ligase beta subunit-related protein [Moorella thermoacetica]APC09233.1 phenylalanine--tRNA ligase beta subunit [Moorella thermoacetica]